MDIKNNETKELRDLWKHVKIHYKYETCCKSNKKNSLVSIKSLFQHISDKQKSDNFHSLISFVLKLRNSNGLFDI